ncbi:MAG: putative Ig domain-containing protein, partial [Bryobacteraceae bacterium]
MKNAIHAIFLSLLFLAPQLFAQSMAIESGNGQVVKEQFLSVPLVVQVKDAAGNPSAGVKVTWGVTLGAGTLLNQSAATDARGFASAIFLSTSIQPGNSFVPNTVTATSTVGSVNFHITTALGQGFALLPLVELIKPPQTSTGLTGPSGTVLPGAVEIQVTAQSGIQTGQPVPNVSLRIVNNLDPTAPAAAACNVPGGTVLTNTAGRAVCDVILTGAPGTYNLTALVGEYQYTSAFNLKVTDAPACAFSVTLSNSTFGGAASSGTINVATTAGCGWTASSNTPWIAFTTTPSGSGTGTVSFNVAANPTAPRSGSIQVAGQTLVVTQGTGAGPSALAITSPAALPSGTLNTSYAVALAATGGQTPYLWSVLGTLPNNLQLNSSTGVISGVPSAVGSYNITASVTDAAGTVRTQTFTFSVVSESAGPAITNLSFPNGVIGQAYRQDLTSSGGCATPFSPVPTFTLSSGTLPAGLTLVNAATGFSIAGTPTTAGTSSFVLTVKDACGRLSSSTFTLTVNGASTSSSLVVSPASLTFNIQQGANLPPLQTVLLTGANGATLAFSAVPSASLLSVNPGAGTTTAALSVGLSTTALAPGPYNASIAISSPGIAGVITLPVTINVSAGTSLTVSPNQLIFRDA